MFEPAWRFRRSIPVKIGSKTSWMVADVMGILRTAMLWKPLWFLQGASWPTQRSCGSVQKWIMHIYQSALLFDCCGVKSFKSLIFKSWVPRTNFRQPNSRIKRFSTWVAEILILVHVPSIWCARTLCNVVESSSISPSHGVVQLPQGCEVERTWRSGGS